MHAIDVEALGIELFAYRLAGNGRRNRRFASAICLCLTVVHKIFAEQFHRNRILYRRILRVFGIRHLNGDQLTVTHAHMVGHLIVCYRVSVPHKSAPVLLKLLDGVCKGDIDHGAAKLLVLQIRERQLRLVPFENFFHFQRVKALVQHTAESVGIEFSVLARRDSVFQNVTSVDRNDPRHFRLFLCTFFHRSTSFSLFFFSALTLQRFS